MKFIETSLLTESINQINLLRQKSFRILLIYTHTYT